MDHSQQDTVKAVTMDEILAKKWVVGRKDTYSPSKKSKVYHEKYSRAEGNKWKNEVKLKTQTTLPMTPGKLLYSVELPSDTIRMEISIHYSKNKAPEHLRQLN